MTKPEHRALFLGAGIHSVLGSDIAKNLEGLRQAPSPPSLHVNTLTDDNPEIPYKLLADSPLEDPEARLYRVVREVAEQALDEAGLCAKQRTRMGLFIGSSSFDLSAWEARYQLELAESSQALALRDTSIAILADFIVQEMGLIGDDYSFNTACTASANALIAAVSHVESGLMEHALVLGVELYNEVTALGFEGLGLLTRSVMKPFDTSRDGLVLGECVSALVIGREPNAGENRFYLRGSANLADCYSITAANPDGSSITAVMEQALANAGLHADQVTALKVHGTASLSNDEAEAAGMHALFTKLPPLCALKPHIGHTLGACGLNELVLFYRALEAGFLVATPDISVTGGDLEVALNQVPVSLEPGNFMLNYFGFGGNNTSLLISNLA